MYCQKCGRQIDDEAIICPDCGSPTINYKPRRAQRTSTPTKKEAVPESSKYQVVNPPTIFSHSNIGKKKKKVCIAIGACFVLLVFSAILWKAVGSSILLQSNIVFVETVPDEDVWETETEIEFVKYPGKCKPGDKVLAEIKAKPNAYYSISVYDDSGRVKANTLVGTTTNAAGKANWSWHISENVSPGIYYIQISDRSGDQNCIDYYILDKDGNIVGNSPSREDSITEEDQTFTIETEDIEHPTGQGQMVYITENGFKYHKPTCHHVSNG